ncbi:MAG: HAD family hydrolase [Thermoplasmata archaeon]|nr:HAD family hydrolase [Thermoplasmata archaeon]
MSENPAPVTKGVVLDLDDTLVPWQTIPHWQWAWKPRGPVLSERHARAAIRRQQHLWDRRRWQGLVGRAPPSDVAAYRIFLAETLSAIAGHALPDAETHAVVERFLKPAHEQESYPDAYPAVRAIEERKLKVAVITELPAENAKYALRRAGLPDALLLLAGDAPMPRPPSVAGFREIARRLEAKPSELWFVGDLFWSDVRAAARAGLTSVLLDRADAADQVLETRIRSLAQLPALLDAPRAPPASSPTGPDEPGPA